MKKFISAILCLFLILPSFLTVQATDPDSPRIVDIAGVLTSDELAELTQKANNLRYTYDMDVVIVVVRDLDGKSAQDYADDFYDTNGYGVGSEYSGVLLLIATESRDWWISTCGDGIYALTDYGIERIFSSFSGYLSHNNYYAAFRAYLEALPEYFEAFKDGDPIDGFAGNYEGPGSYQPGDAEDVVYYDSSSFGVKNILISLLIGCAVAAIVLLIMSGMMNTKRKQRSATDYVAKDSYRLNGYSDLFLYSNVTKVARQDNSSSGGGSSTHSSSSGRSHGGGGGKF